MRNSLVCAAVALTAVAATSQTTSVSPAAMTNAYGGINNSIPWGPFVPSGNTIGEIMALQIDNEMLGRIVQINGMSFRHQYTSTHVAKAFTSTVTLGDAASPAAGISSVFANNFKVGGNQTTVFTGVINFPAVGPYSRPPAAFDSPVVFQTPYFHGGTDPLAWQVVTLGTTPVTPTQFYERGPGSTHTAGALGVGCPITGSVTPMGATGTISGTTMTNNMTAGPASTTAILLFGTASDLLGGAVPLPVNLAFIGSPACDLNIDPFADLAVATTATGTATRSLPYTMSPAVSGQRIRTQWVAVDASFAVVTSNGLDHAFPFNASTGNAWPLSRVYANNFGATPPASGTLQINGLVTQYMH